MRRRDTGSAERRPFQAGPIDQRASRPRNALRHHVPLRHRILEHAARTRQVQRLRPLAVVERAACRGAQYHRVTWRDDEVYRQQHLAGGLHAASIVTEAHRRYLDFRDHALPCAQPDRRQQLADEPPAEVRVAAHGAADGAWSAGPLFDAGQPVRDRPAHEPVDGHRGVGANVPGVNRHDGAAPGPDDERPHPAVGHQHIRTTAEQYHRDARVMRNPQRPHHVVRPAGLDQPLCGPTHLERGQFAQWRLAP